MTGRWELSFAAVAALIGEPLEAITAALGEGRHRATDVLRGLEGPDRAARARAIAAVVAHVAKDVESARLA
ncbi:MAG: hypothetical protein FWD17_19970 [Polyangiaceae bacterium]|nr:hypothetical protein [Polyangiaceae bacterium]